MQCSSLQIACSVPGVESDEMELIIDGVETTAVLGCSSAPSRVGVKLKWFFLCDFFPQSMCRSTARYYGFIDWILRGLTHRYSSPKVKEPIRYRTKILFHIPHAKHHNSKNYFNIFAVIINKKIAGFYKQMVFKKM